MKSILMLLFSILCLSDAFAIDYYVRPAGGNYGLEDGSSYANAWDGFSKIDWVKVDKGNGKLFIAGIHREHLIIGASGEPGTPVQIVSCVTDNGAIIDDPGILLGSSVASNNAHWTSQGEGNRWHLTGIPILYDIGFVLFGRESQANCSIKVETAETDVNLDKEFYYDSINDWIVVYTADNSNPYTYYGNIEIPNPTTGSGNEALILIDNNDYINVEGLTMKYFAGHGLRAVNGSDYINILNCNASYGGGQIVTGNERYGNAFDCVNNTSNVTINGCTATQIWDWGICLGELWEHLGEGIWTIHDNIASNNTVSYCGGGISAAQERNTMGINTVEDNCVFNNTITHIGYGWGGVGSSNGISIYLRGHTTGLPSDITIMNNYISNGKGKGIAIYGAHSFQIQRNYIKNVKYGIYVSQHDDNVNSEGIIAYNIICNPGFGGIYNVKNDGVLHIYNNTVYLTGGPGVRCFAIMSSSNNSIWRNNIGYNNVSPVIQIDSTSSADIDNNLYYRASGLSNNVIQLGDKYYCYSGCKDDWTAYLSVTKNDDNSIAGSNPLFGNASEDDFHISSISLARDKGVYVGLNGDYEGTPVPQGSGVDIGAFEFVPEAIIDTIPPIGTVIINNSDDITHSMSVILSLFAIDEGKELDGNGMMTFSNDGQKWSAPEPYATSKIWTLTPGSGEKTVYAKFRDAAGNWMTEPAEDKIMYEESQHADTPPLGTIIINSGESVSRSLHVILTLFAIDDGKELDDAGRMTFSNDGQEWSTPEPYAKGKVWTLLPGKGEKTVYVKFCDAAGNWMKEPAQDRIIYEASDITCDNPQKLQPVAATASSELLPRYSKNNVFDGNPLTAWSAFSFVKKDQFITLDLGKIKSLRGLSMYASKMFGTDFFPADFQIEVSRDNSTWASISKEWGYTPPFQPPYAGKWDFDGIDCRFVRIIITKSKTLFLFFNLAQIAEIEVYGCDVEEATPSPFGKAPALIPSQEETGRIKLEDAIKTKQGKLSAPGRPVVRFK